MTAGIATSTAGQDVFDTAILAWDAGHYIEALTGFETILTGPDAQRHFRDIALTTGELFKTTELAPDGTAPVWSSDNQWIAFQVIVDGHTVTNVVPRNGGTARLIEGHHVTFDPESNQAVSIHVNEGPELERARADARARIQVRDITSFRRLQREVNRVTAEYSTLRVVSFPDGGDGEIGTTGLAVSDVTWGRSGGLVFLAHEAGGPGDPQLYATDRSANPRRLTDTTGPKSNLVRVAPDIVAYEIDGGFTLMNVETDATRSLQGNSPAFSSDGSTGVYLDESAGSNRVLRFGVTTSAEPTVMYETTNALANPAVSPSGDKLVFQEMLRENWELMVVGAGIAEVERITWDVQHDLFPRFLDEDRVFSVMGEGRHRRSYIHEVTTGQRTKVFHNNTVRTVAPEYEWAVSPDASAVVIVSERDGDTISPERGVYLTELNDTISNADLLHRVRQNLNAEGSLRERGEAMFRPIQDAVRTVVADVSTARIYGYAADLFSFGSKFITAPGNAQAIEYISRQLQAWGYEPELQWFEPRPGIRSANIVATLRGTVDPDLVYVVSSHFDSVNRGPGADDNSSGTTALLEAARVLRHNPQRATIKFAFFTGEEAGLLGSREFVRRAVESGEQIVGALNNDMVGYANNHRMDNTIRYSNAGIRDMQHAAAFLFTNLITYDAKYYKSTDAHAYYDAYGDIVGGIGSYPILGNPHYHQSHDVLETINQQLVAEVSKTTVASLMLLASSPSRLKDVTVQRQGNTTTLTWTAAPESNVDHYVVRYGTNEMTTRENRVTLPNVTDGQGIAVKAVGDRELSSWDWAYPSQAPER